MWWAWRLVCGDSDKPCLASKQFRSVTADIRFCALQALEINNQLSGHLAELGCWVPQKLDQDWQRWLAVAFVSHMDRLNSVVMEARIGRFALTFELHVLWPLGWSAKVADPVMKGASPTQPWHRRIGLPHCCTGLSRDLEAKWRRRQTQPATSLALSRLHSFACSW